MLVISDTNILGSFAAGEAIHLLFRLFPKTTIFIPPAVHQELQDRFASFIALAVDAKCRIAS